MIWTSSIYIVPENPSLNGSAIANPDGDLGEVVQSAGLIDVPADVQPLIEVRLADGDLAADGTARGRVPDREEFLRQVCRVHRNGTGSHREVHPRGHAVPREIDRASRRAQRHLNRCTPCVIQRIRGDPKRHGEGTAAAMETRRAHGDVRDSGARIRRVYPPTLGGAGLEPPVEAARSRRTTGGTHTLVAGASAGLARAVQTARARRVVRRVRRGADAGARVARARRVTGRRRRAGDRVAPGADRRPGRCRSACRRCRRCTTVPLAALVCAEHCPVDGLQVPATLHVAAAGQVTGLFPVHTPP